MKRYTVDASIIIKWVVGSEREPDHDNAMALLDSWAREQMEIYAPSLWQFEVGNFLGREIPTTASDKMEFLVNLGILDVPMSLTICQECFGLMERRQVTFYHAAYLAAAVATESVLITVDERFVKKIGTHANLCPLNQLDLRRDDRS